MPCSKAGLLCVLCAASSLVIAKNDPLHISGLLHHSVQLSSYLNLTLPIEDVIWKFTTKGRMMKMAEIRNNHLKVGNPQFMDRLDMFRNGTGLQILGITTEDAGIYTAQITLTNLEMQQASFSLAVYEPVPNPSIRTKLKNLSSNQCNVTLHSSVPTNSTSSSSSLSYSWRYKNSDYDYQLYNVTGDTIQMSLEPEYWNMEIMCIVYNPADQKNFSVRLQQICALENSSDPYLCFMVILGIPILLTVLVIWLKRSRVIGDMNNAGCCSSTSRETNSSTHNFTAADLPAPDQLDYTTIYHLPPQRGSNFPQRTEEKAASDTSDTVYADVNPLLV